MVIPKLTKPNPHESNAFWGTSIGGNFDCSFAPICASNFRVTYRIQMADRLR
jgi:hypothetical protein